MARYARKDFGLGKPKKRETANARKVADQAQRVDVPLSIHTCKVLEVIFFKKLYSLNTYST